MFFNDVNYNLLSVCLSEGFKDYGTRQDRDT